MTAVDIARHRLAAIDDEGIQRMLRYYAELMRATDEKRRGEWVLPREVVSPAKGTEA